MIATRTNTSIDRDLRSRLLAEAQRGDVAARDRLLELDRGLIVAIAQDRFRRDSAPGSGRPRPQDPDEFMSHAVEAYIDAVRLFDPSRGFQFSTYAYHSMERRCHRASSSGSAGGALPLPRTEGKARRTPQRLAFRALAQRTISHDPRRDRRGAPAADLDGSIDRRVELRRVRHVLSILPERWRDVLMLRAGGHSHRSIGSLFGLSRQWAGRTERLALDRVRAFLILAAAEQEAFA